MDKIWLTWKETTNSYPYIKLKIMEFDNGDWGTQRRDNMYENLMTGDDEKVLVDSIKYHNDKYPCSYHAHYLNEKLKDSEEDPATYAHCSECHSDDWDHHEINGPNCNHTAGCPNC